MRRRTLAARALILLGLLALVPIGAVLAWALPGALLKTTGIGVSIVAWVGIVWLLGSRGRWESIR